MTRFGCLASFALLLSGCYRTVVATSAPPAGPVHEDRQWFTIAGFVPLSDAAGAECGPAGVSHAESRLAGMDILIDLGLSLVGGAVGFAVCDEDDFDEARNYASCVSAVAAIPPFLISSRTVSYQCSGGGGAPMSPVPGAAPQ
jgi:hypothetical protein